MLLVVGFAEWAVIWAVVIALGYAIDRWVTIRGRALNIAMRLTEPLHQMTGVLLESPILTPPVAEFVEQIARLSVHPALSASIARRGWMRRRPRPTDTSTELNRDLESLPEAIQSGIGTSLGLALVISAQMHPFRPRKYTQLLGAAVGKTEPEPARVTPTAKKAAAAYVLDSMPDRHLGHVMPV